MFLSRSIKSKSHVLSFSRKSKKVTAGEHERFSIHSDSGFRAPKCASLGYYLRLWSPVSTCEPTDTINLTRAERKSILHAN